MTVVYKINGQRVSKRQWDRRKGRGLRLEDQRAPMGTVAYSESKPLESLALSCHRDLAAEYNAVAKKLGLTGIKWKSNGDCVITSRSDRKKWLRSQHQHDADGGYSDG